MKECRSFFFCHLYNVLSRSCADPVMEERSLEQVVSGILESVLHLEDHVQAGFNVILHELENDGCVSVVSRNITALSFNL